MNFREDGGGGGGGGGLRPRDLCCEHHELLTNKLLI